jgi:hypothetical protein
LVHIARFRSGDAYNQVYRCVKAAQFRAIVVNNSLPHPQKLIEDG